MPLAVVCQTRFLTASDGYTKDLRRALLSSFSPTGSVIRREREIGVGWHPVRSGAWTGTGSVCDASRGLSSEGKKPRCCARVETFGEVFTALRVRRGTQELVASRDTLEARPSPSFLPPTCRPHRRPSWRRDCTRTNVPTTTMPPACRRRRDP